MPGRQRTFREYKNASDAYWGHISLSAHYQQVGIGAALVIKSLLRETSHIDTNDTRSSAGTGPAYLLDQARYGGSAATRAEGRQADVTST